MHLNICDDELCHLVGCWVTADLAYYWLTVTDVSWVHDFCGFCRPSEQATYFASDIFDGVFPDEAQQLVFCKEPQRSHLPSSESLMTKKNKKNPIVSNNQRKDKPVSDQRTCGLLRSFFYIPLSWCLTSFLSSDWPVPHPSPFILGITTKTDATLLFISCTRRTRFFILLLSARSKTSLCCSDLPRLEWR